MAFAIDGRNEARLFSIIHWGVILGVRAQGVTLSPNQPLNYRAQGFWPVTFGVD
jgi:hypothetical protein